ncbi:MAG: hypothetical protein M1816_003742 [Peltula sp. TS41687]|nr:MAG: hypothetical protein M1816_003742 [Peltula sp. TS41687]
MSNPVSTLKARPSNDYQSAQEFLNACFPPGTVKGDQGDPARVGSRIMLQPPLQEGTSRSFKITPSEYGQLRDMLKLDEQRPIKRDHFVRSRYYQWPPTFIRCCARHDDCQMHAHPRSNAIANDLGRAFNQAEMAVPASYGWALQTRLNQKYYRFQGMYAGSSKTPDLAVGFKQNGVSKLKLVVEVGFSEEYDQLVNDARLWLEGQPSVLMVVLIKLIEQPRYRNPLREFDDDEIKALNLPSPDEMREDLEADPTTPALGPVCHRGYAWTGALSSVWVEHWRRDGKGKACKTGGAWDILETKDTGPLTFRLSDFTPLQAKDDVVVSVAWSTLAESLSTELRELAADRFDDVTTKSARRRGSLGSMHGT